MHAMPRWYRESRQAHGAGSVEREPVERTLHPDAGRLDLRLGSGGLQSADLRHEIFSRRAEQAARHLVKPWTTRPSRPDTATTRRASRAAKTSTPASRALRITRRPTRSRARLTAMARR